MPDEMNDVRENQKTKYNIAYRTKIRFNFVVILAQNMTEVC